MYKKETLNDPNTPSGTYVNYVLHKDVGFCCASLKSHCKKFAGWDYEKGRFVIVDKITYDGHTTSAIDFCPFCGEPIEYGEFDKSKKIQ